MRLRLPECAGETHEPLEATFLRPLRLRAARRVGESPTRSRGVSRGRHPALRAGPATGEFFKARIVSRGHAPYVPAQVFAPFGGAA
jgi:hypothetical protein